MGADTLRQVAKSNYGQDLSKEEVEQRIASYHQLCPELDEFLSDEIDTGLRIAKNPQLDS